MAPKQTASLAAGEITGQAALPISRVKKIIQLDDDIVQCSQNATFLITVATEMFIRYLAEQGHNVMKSERKPRKLIQYKDLATAVSRIDNLEFLSDVIPKTTTYKQFKERKAKEAAKNASAVGKGQRTLNGSVASTAGSKASRMSIRPEDLAQAGGVDTTSNQSTSHPPGRHTAHAAGSLSTLMVDRTLENSTAPNEDVEMSSD